MGDYKEYSKNKMSNEDKNTVDVYLSSPDLEGVS
jgi:hypothetical protein